MAEATTSRIDGDLDAQSPAADLVRVYLNGELKPEISGKVSGGWGSELDFYFAGRPDGLRPSSGEDMIVATN